MKLYVYVTPTHVPMFETLLQLSASEFEIITRQGEQIGDGEFGTPGFRETQRRKVAFYLEVLRQNPGEVMLFTDADILICGPVVERLEEFVADVELATMADGVRLCAGFMVIRSTPSTEQLMETIAADPREHMGRCELADQAALNVYKYLVHWKGFRCASSGTSATRSCVGGARLPGCTGSSCRVRYEPSTRITVSGLNGRNGYSSASRTCCRN